MIRAILLIVLLAWNVPVLADIIGKPRVIDGDTIDVAGQRIPCAAQYHDRGLPSAPSRLQDVLEIEKQRLIILPSALRNKTLTTSDVK